MKKIIFKLLHFGLGHFFLDGNLLEQISISYIIHQIRGYKGIVKNITADAFLAEIGLLKNLLHFYDLINDIYTFKTCYCFRVPFYQMKTSRC